MRARALRWLACAAALAAASPSPGTAQGPAHTPAPGSPERAAVLDALRPAVEQRLRVHVVFADVQLRTYDGWAFVRTIPYAREDERADTVSDLRIDERYDPFVYGLLRNTAGGWRLVETAIEVAPAATPHTSWAARFGAPAALFQRDPDDVALEAAMREFIDAMAAGSPERFLALLPRTAAVREVNTITPELLSATFTRAELARDFRRKDGAYGFWFGEVDERGEKVFDYYAERFQAAEGGTRRMWRRSAGNTYYSPGELRDGLRTGAVYVRWMKEDGRWVITEMAIVAS